MPVRLTTEQFIEKAIAKHGDRYDYSLVEYVNKRTKVKIGCIEHGYFLSRRQMYTLAKVVGVLSVVKFRRQISEG